VRERSDFIMRSKQEYIEKVESEIYKIYNRFPIVFDHGDGVRLYDTDGEEYLDFGAGIAVIGLGYNDPEFNKALKEQVDKLLHTSNLFYNVPAMEAGELILKASGMDKVFFTNSGTEAVEGALKIARRFAYNKDGSHDHEIIAMKHSFHGRSFGALSVTGNDHYQEPFKPLLPGIKFAEFNDLDSVKKLVNDKTCAIIMETVQGEGGIYPASEEFLKGVRALCDEHDMLLILDEIQCGMGRTGTMFAWQKYGVKPDVMTVAKALGNGVPVGAFLAAGKAATAMSPGDHGTTYGGNPFVTAAAFKVLELFEKRKIVDHVKEMGEYLAKKLNSLSERYDIITGQRGVLISAGTNVIRFVPPLVIEKEHVDEMVEKLEAVLKGQL
jgi:acetylornithine/N-succinyldiaminopimelate aminotransferase